MNRFLKRDLPAIFVCLLWASAFTGVKIALEYVTPIFLSGVRFMLAGVMLLPVLLLQKISWRQVVKEWRFLLLITLVQTALHYSIYTLGLNYVSGAVSAVIVGAAPLFVALTAHLSIADDHLNLRKLLAILLGLAGIVFIAFSKGVSGTEGGNFYIGVLLLVMSNIFAAGGDVLVARNRGRVHPVLLASISNFFGGLMMLLFSLTIEQGEVKPVDGRFFAALVWLAFISAASFSIWYALIKRPDTKVSQLNFWRFLIPVFGSVLAWLMVPGEHPDRSTVIGILIIAVALIILQAAPKKRAA